MIANCKLVFGSMVCDLFNALEIIFYLIFMFYMCFHRKCHTGVTPGFRGWNACTSDSQNRTSLPVGMYGFQEFDGNKRWDSQRTVGIYTAP